jgi:hypothetical protein
MTKVQRHFQLQRPIDEPLMEQIAHVNSIYGIERIRIEPSGNLMVEYDATRLNVAQVEAALEQAGIPVNETVSA